MGSITDYICPNCRGAKENRDDESCAKCASVNLPTSSQSLVAAALQKIGKDVASPHRENAPYDLLIKDVNGWAQCQVKSAYKGGDNVVANTCRTTATGREPYSTKDVHIFAIVWGRDVWLIPHIEVEGKTRVHILSSKYDKWRVKW